MKKIVNTVLSLAIILNMVLVPATAKESNVEGLFVSNEGHGSFKLASADVSTNSFKSDHAVMQIQQIDDNIYCLESDPDYKLAKVNETTFQAVDEIGLNIGDLNSVYDIIEEYDLDEAILNDLILLNKKATENANNKINVTVYVPAKNPIVAAEDSNSDPMVSLSATQDSYYIGYNNAKYKDAFVSANGDSGYQEVDQLSRIASTIANTTLTTLISLADKYSVLGPATTLGEIYGSVYKTFPSNSSIFTQVTSIEHKYRKYTSIEDPYYPGQFTCRAICDSGWQYFRYRVVIPENNNTEQISNGKEGDYRGPSWSTLDQKAYQYRTGGGIEIYDEKTDGFKLNTYNYFASVTA